MGTTIVFSILSVLMLALAVMSVTARKTLRSVVYLLFVLLGTAGIYILLNYHFLAMVQIAVYAGGIVVLFIFAILLVNEKADGKKLPIPSFKKMAAGAGIALAGAAVVLFSILKMNFLYGSNTTIVGDQEIDMKEIGFAMLGTDKHQYLLTLEIMGVLLLACAVGGIIIARKKEEE